MKKSTAIILTAGLLKSKNAKTCHGLLRGTDRFEILAIIDSKYYGKDSGEILYGVPNGIPIYKDVDEFINKTSKKPKYFVIGVAPEGGLLPDDFRGELYAGMAHGISIVGGLHTLLSEDNEFIKKSKEYGVTLTDIRKPRKYNELRFWTGEINNVRANVIAVLGTDCAVGKRTTSRLVLEGLNKNGIKAEMIYTGQTGWMQGYQHGFIFDSTLNDFISGEIERAIVACDADANPEVIIIEGQSSLQNPSGPCGSEFLISGNAKGVILQHQPGRKNYDFNEDWGEVKPLEDEIKLIELFGSQVLCITLNGDHMDKNTLVEYQSKMEEKLGIPIVLPLEDGVDRITSSIKDYLTNKKRIKNQKDTTIL